MPNYSKAMVVGRLAKDPELRTLSNSHKVCNLLICVLSHHTTKAGLKKERSDFLPVACWGALGEACHRELAKNSLVLADVQIQSRQYTNAEGVCRSNIELLGVGITFLERSARVEMTSEDDHAESAPLAADELGEIPF